MAFNQRLRSLFNRYKEIIVRNKINTSDKKWAESWKDTTPDGKYNIECENEAKELLLKMGWQISDTRSDGVEYWTRPYKDPKEGFSATFGHHKGMFYIFSEDQNCAPFVSKQAYSPFNILTELKYDGNWKRAKDDLRANSTWWTMMSFGVRMRKETILFLIFRRKRQFLKAIGVPTQLDRAESGFRSVLPPK